MREQLCTFSVILNLAVFCPAALAADARSSPAPALANAPVEIERLVDDALRNNPELAFYQAELAAAKSERRQAGAWPNPELNAEAGRKRSRDPSGSLAGEGMAWSVSLAQPLDFPGRIALRKAIADRQVELAELGLEQFRRTLAARVREAAYRLFIAQARAESASQAARRGRDLMEVLVQRDPAGITPLLEMRLIEASVIALSGRATDATAQAIAAAAELSHLRGRPPGEAPRIAPARLDFSALPPASVLAAQALTNNYEIRAQQVELAQQGLRVDLARKDRWKEINVAPFYAQEKAGERETVAGLGVSIPVPLWNRNQGSIAAAEARQNQAETAVALVQRRIEREVRERAEAYSARLEQISQWPADIEENLREAAELADRHYRLGAVPVATYVELQEKYLEALEAIHSTRASALEDRHRIELSIGAPVPPVKGGDQ